MGHDQGDVRNGQTVGVQRFLNDLREAHHCMAEHLAAVHAGPLAVVFQVFGAQAWRFGGGGQLDENLLIIFALGVQMAAEDPTVLFGGGDHRRAGAVTEKHAYVPPGGG